MNALGIFVAHPWLALVIGAGLGVLWFRRRRFLAAAAATAWLAYGVYEYLMFGRVLCGGECNIRVDLVAIYPALLALSTLAVVHVLRSRRGQGDAADRPADADADGRPLLR